MEELLKEAFSFYPSEFVTRISILFTTEKIWPSVVYLL